MDLSIFPQFIDFLHKELGISVADLQLALQRSQQTPSLVPIVLWQYGLVTLFQLNQILDWLENFSVSSFTIV